MFAKELTNFFLNNDIPSLKQHLVKTAKNKFVIDTIEANPSIKSVLEIGCSRGYLGAYFIAKGYNYRGIDISHTAIKAAKSYFGNCFYLPEELTNCDTTYDAIFHVGTIGCVESPLDFIQDSLNQLSSNGVLIFNAPNTAAAKKFKDIWVSGTTPPDLVTLFSSEIWEKKFGKQAGVNIIIGKEPPELALKKLIRKVRTGTSLKQSTQYLYKTSAKNPPLTQPKIKNKKIAAFLSKLYHKAISIFARSIGMGRTPGEFGLYVVLKKK
jgi:SAM-dependent methyltransferase